MSGTILIQNRQRVIPIRARPLRRLTLSLLRDHLHRERFDLVVRLVRSPEITRLNETYLRHQGPTDVITFDYTNPPHRPPTTPPRRRPAALPQSPALLHGEIVICADEVLAQARRYRRPWPEELARYIIHGVLHLEGHDDARQAQRRRMKQCEDRLLQALAPPLVQGSRSSRSNLKALRPEKRLGPRRPASSRASP